jgi:hypothetical protein
MTARLPKSGWTTEGDRHVAWPVDHYFDEGSRAGSWFVDGVVRWPALLAVRAVKPR